MNDAGHASYINEKYESGEWETKERRGDRERMAAKIAALLASAETAAKDGNETLRDQYLGKASALQLKYAITDAMLKQEDQERILYQDFCRESNTPLIKAKRELIAGLTSLYRGKAHMGVELKKDNEGNILWRNGRPMYNKRAYVRVYAHESDLQFISMMYTSLILQMQTMMATDEKKAIRVEPCPTCMGKLRWVEDQWACEECEDEFADNDIESGKVTNAWRVSYAYAWVRRVYTRLLATQQRQEVAEKATEPGTALVLADRKAVVDKYVTDQVGKLKKASYRSDDNNFEGRIAGYEAGDRADIGQKKVSNKQPERLES
jgi:hypothetical protein